MKQKQIIIVAFGDSITQAGRQTEDKRWPELLRKMLREHFPDYEIAVQNAGVGGNTSREGLARMDKDVLSHKPDYVLVEFGGNDATMETNRHVALDEFARNLLEIKEKIERNTGARVLLLTFPPVIDELHQYGRHEFFTKDGGLDACVEKYRELTRDFAREHRLPLADIDQALRKNPPENILQDGVHLTDTGNRVLAEAVYEVMRMEIGG